MKLRLRFTVLLIAVWSTSATCHVLRGGEKDKKQTLSSASIWLGGQSSDRGNYLDIFSSEIYQNAQAARNAEDVQLMYVYGKNSKANFFLPGSSAIRRYAKSAQERINAWSHRQEGQMINIGDAHELFLGFNSLSDISKAYGQYRNKVYEKVGYEVSEQGPADALQKISEGDVILLHLFGQETFVAIRVRNLTPGADGSITFDIKYDKNATAASDGFVEKSPNAQQDWQVDVTYADKHYQSEYLVGDAPLVLSVPHGGTMNPLDIPDRSCKGAVLGRDTHTIELTREIQKILVEEYGVKPHVVVSNLSRRKVDLNRAIERGTCGNEEAKPAWQQYHNYVDTALKEVLKKHKNALLLDMHGHAIRIERLQLGYLIGGEKIAEAYKGNELQELARKSSVQNLIPIGEEQKLQELLFGENAFGTLAENNGVRSVPSKQDPHPKEGERYLSRGYITQHYTTPDYPKVHGIQVEINREVRSDEGRKKYAGKMAKTIVEYMRLKGLVE
ncbi:N-formylglutamate amidohydrolase [Sinomicrobium sp.]